MSCKSRSLLAGFWILPMICFLCSLATAQGHGPGSPEVYRADGQSMMYSGTQLVIGTPYFMTLPGRPIVIKISLNNPVPVGSLDLLLSFDPRPLGFCFAQPTGMLKNWEFFTYRYSKADTCGDGCPMAFLRLIGIANMPDGVDPGAVYQPAGEIIELRFDYSSECSFIGLYPRLGFVWNDCQDNTFTSISGDTIYTLTSLPDSCLAHLAPKQVTRLLSFQDSFIYCVSPDDEGDVNLNGYECEVGDAVLFAQYFAFGPAVLHDATPPDYYDNRVLATDFNDDGQPLTPADLQCLLRIITDADWSIIGDGDPKNAAGTAEVDMGRAPGENIVISVGSPNGIGTAALVFRHTGIEVGSPILAEKANHMTLSYSDRDGLLRVLVYSLKGNSIAAVRHQLFTVPVNGDGTFELIEVRVSDAEGNALGVNTTK